MSNREGTSELTAALLDELRASREVTASTLSMIVKMQERFDTAQAAQGGDPWQKRSEELKEQRNNRPLREEVVTKDRISPFTGAMYDEKVVDGVVRDILNYRYPEWAVKRVADGGQIPNEMIALSPPDPYRMDRTAENVAYLQWRYVATYQIDLRAIVGEPTGAPRVKGNDSPFAYASTPEVDAS